jgi:glyoxylase-like metal-dependent hydrolase (beta-lactamase superfamily II)
VIAHRLDAPYIEGRHQQQVDRNNMGLNILLQAMDKFWPVFPVTVTSIVDDGDELQGGMIVRHMPGHTPGSPSLFMPERRLIIVGDLLSNTFGLSLPSRMFTVDRDEELRSLKKLEEMEFDIICFGHGKPITYHAHDTVSGFVKKINAR